MTALDQSAYISIDSLDERRPSLVSAGTEGKEISGVIAAMLRHLKEPRATEVMDEPDDEESYRHVTLPVLRTIKVRLIPGGQLQPRHVEFEEDE